jgi:hypothetical protein
MITFVISDYTENKENLCSSGVHVVRLIIACQFGSATQHSKKTEGEAAPTEVQSRDQFSYFVVDI